VTRYETWIAKRSGIQRQVAQDRVPQARLYKIWNVPERNSADADLLGLVASVLASGKTSRLYKRLVYDDQIATDVSAYVDSREIAGLFTIVATAKPGGDLAKIEKATDEELARLLRDGPTADELERVKTEFVSGFIRGVERIGGFGGKSDVLARGQVFAGDPASYKVSLRRIENATEAQLKNVANQWLSDGVYVLEIHPFEEFKAASAGVDRSSRPGPGTPPPASFPALQRATLSNGLRVVLAERHAVPVVWLNLVVDAGFAADQFAVPGNASLAMNMIDEGTRSRSALQISDELARLGAELYTGSDLDNSFVFLSALKGRLDASLALYADIVLNPSFPAEELVRLKAQQLAGIQAEKAQPFGMALRTFPKLLYGADHAYGTPFTGSGYEKTVATISREDVAKFHRTWFKPDHATLIIVGDTKLEEIRPKLEALFKDWKGGAVPKKNLKEVPQQPKEIVYLVDRPGSIQSIVVAGHLAPPKANPDEIAIETLNYVLGGSFVSRINMNLREDKHWTYGAGSAIIDAKGQRPFVAYTSVQTDKTKETLEEIAKELRGPSGPRPVSEDELSMAQAGQTLGLAGQWETAASVGGSIAEIERFGLPDDYFATYPGKVRALKTADMIKAAGKLLHPDRVVWIVVGDRSKIESPIRDLGFGEIRRIDADGNAVADK
jgi:zinc protease